MSQSQPSTPPTSAPNTSDAMTPAAVLPPLSESTVLVWLNHNWPEESWDNVEKGFCDLELYLVDLVAGPRHIQQTNVLMDMILDRFDVLRFGPMSLAEAMAAHDSRQV